MLRRSDIARELLRRKRCRDSIHSFALNIQIPTVAAAPLCPDEDLTGPAAELMATHHAAILSCIQRVMSRPMGRGLLMLPPGSAKSLYADCVATTWYMGNHPGSRIMLTGYQGDLAERQSARAQFIVEQEAYRNIFPGRPRLGKDAKKDWMIEFDGFPASNMLAMGLTGGLTGNRANGWIVDDPLAGRKEADSETQRQDCYNAYKDDLLTRSLPNAWGFIILTRWHEDDIAGRILPADYDGASGMIQGTDGLMWDVLNIPAKCERKDDPLGRRIGDYIWPEYYPPAHWHMFEYAKGSEAARTWSSLYQQRPTAQGAGRFHESMFHFYREGEQPPHLATVGASDHAVTEGKNDFSEAAVMGVDSRGEWWELDWWHDQVDTGKAANTVLDMAKKWGVNMWFNEGGVIDKAMRPLFNVIMNERARKGSPVYLDIRALTSMQDKVAKCASTQGRAASGGEKGDGTWNPGVIHMRDNANSRRVVQQLCALPAGRFDDAADVMGLFGRGLDLFPVVYDPQTHRKQGLVPFSVAWLEHQEKTEANVRYR